MGSRVGCVVVGLLVGAPVGKAVGLVGEHVGTLVGVELGELVGVEGCDVGWPVGTDGFDVG